MPPPILSHQDQPVVAADGSIQSVIVWIDGIEGSAPPAPDKPAVLDQKGCLYVPHVLSMTVVLADGQRVKSAAVTHGALKVVIAESTGVSQPLTAPVFMEYDAVGIRMWQQQGHESARRTHFRYYTSGPAAGQLRAVQSPVTAGGFSPRDSLVYDAQGNLSMTVSPSGLLALHYSDALGRDTLTVTPIDSATATTEAALLASGVRQRTVYDVTDRALVSETLSPARVHAASPDQVFQPAASPAERLVVEITV